MTRIETVDGEMVWVAGKHVTHIEYDPKDKVWVIHLACGQRLESLQSPAALGANAHSQNPLGI